MARASSVLTNILRAAGFLEKQVLRAKRGAAPAAADALPEPLPAATAVGGAAAPLLPDLRALLAAWPASA